VIKEKEKVKTMANDFIEEAETQMKEWLDDFGRLENTIQDAGSEIEQTYHEQIADLKRHLDDAEARFRDLKSSDSEQWPERKLRFQHASWTYQQAYATAINDMKIATNAPAGWLEGFSDRPPAGSAGWLEGTGSQPAGSEGWLEGMTEKGPESEGWTEGYKAKA
jgi:hypothetical protein